MSSTTRKPCYCGHIWLDMPCSRMVAGRPICNTNCHAKALEEVAKEMATRLGFDFRKEPIPRDSSFW